MNKHEETYYEILKVDAKATVAEIVSAYHSAKNAFSKDSIATYSLFSPEEVQQILGKLEEAYLTLSNLEKRSEYDRILAERSDGLEIPEVMTELERKQNAQHLPREAPAPSAPQLEKPPVVDPNATGEIPVVDFNNLNGGVLRAIREKRGLSVDDVARITKIPAKFIRAIEDEIMKQMPARVYIQGFVKNLANLYRLDPATTVKAYLNYLEKVAPNLG